MKKVITIIALLAAAILLGTFLYNSDRNLIDEDYISSNEFWLLEKKLEENRAENQDREFVLNLVSLKIANSSTKDNSNLPYHLDSLAIETLATFENKIQLNNFEAGQSEFKNYDYYSVLTLNEGDITSVFFLMKRPGIYREIDVVMATVKDSSVVDIESIGRFEKNLSEETTSAIQIDKNNSIKTKTIKIRFYPVQQKNIVHYQFTSTKSGEIVVNKTSDN